MLGCCKMSGGPPDEKRVGDATLQRIDDLAAGWSLPKRVRREGGEGTPPAGEGRPEGEKPETKTDSKAAGSGSGGEKTRGSKKKKTREKTRARGKERGKTSATGKRGAGDAPVPPLMRALRGTEQPPEGRLTIQAEDGDRAATEVSDRATTRAMSERVATAVSDRATTRAVEPLDLNASDHAATLIYGERGATEFDESPTIEANRADLIQATRVERESDATVLEAPGSGAYAGARADAVRMTGSTTAILRLPPTLPRRRGPHGDALYVFTAIIGVARANRELAAIDRKLEAEKQSRTRRLADLARLALADSDLDSETLNRGRDEIMDLEDKRSRRAGAVAAADAAIAGLERAREDDQKERAQDQDALRREMAELQEKLEPLQRRARATRRRGFRLQEALRGLDRKVARAEARLSRLGGDKKAAAEAHIAALRAERKAMADERPLLAAELDELEPAIAGLVASGADARARAARMVKDERVAVERTAEKVAAVRARRVVEERAEAELDEAQEEALAVLGERLAVERPPELGPRLRGIEEHEVAIATLERRHLELTELVRALDRWALARGVLWLLALTVAVAAALVWSYALRVP
jgi:hypothetical protein